MGPEIGKAYRRVWYELLSSVIHNFLMRCVVKRLAFGCELHRGQRWVLLQERLRVDAIVGLDTVSSRVEVIGLAAFSKANVLDARHLNEFIQEMDVMDRPASTRHCPIPIGIELVHFGVARPGSSAVEGEIILKLTEPFLHVGE